MKKLKSQRPKRMHWLAGVINDRKYAIGAEIGAASGDTTLYIFKNCPTLKHLVVADNWSPMPNSGWHGMDTKRTFFIRLHHLLPKIKVLEGLSWNMAQNVEDNSLDFIFIDADHNYESVVKDIRAWVPKVKAGGMVSGHDTHFEGVQKALAELIPTHIKESVDHCWQAKKEDVLI
jgi:predicted O-methyltransferase YrrM